MTFSNSLFIYSNIQFCYKQKCFKLFCFIFKFSMGENVLPKCAPDQKPQENACLRGDIRQERMKNGGHTHPPHSCNYTKLNCPTHHKQCQERLYAKKARRSTFYRSRPVAVWIFRFCFFAFFTVSSTTPKPAVARIARETSSVIFSDLPYLRSSAIML